MSRRIAPNTTATNNRQITVNSISKAPSEASAGAPNLATVKAIAPKAPIGAFGAIAFTVAKFGASALASLGALLIEFTAVCLLFVVVVFGTILRLMGLSLFRLLFYIREEIVVVAATTSNEAVLPRIIEKLRGLGCEESVVGLVVPAGYSFNLDGTCLYLATATMFLAQATGTS